MGPLKKSCLSVHCLSDYYQQMAILNVLIRGHATLIFKLTFDGVVENAQIWLPVLLRTNNSKLGM